MIQHVQVRALSVPTHLAGRAGLLWNRRLSVLRLRGQSEVGEVKLGPLSVRAQNIRHIFRVQKRERLRAGAVRVHAHFAMNIRPLLTVKLLENLAVAFHQRS